ncbi:DUF4860 domain-containing protein [Ruminococcaceae bacterium OttesenSCG-928-N02]|nr:DUF4860 domain-containing protein [Ruminococcaceae bacterium OttesenSCG-928-N02]
MLKKKNHAVDMLFTVALFCVFAITALLTVLIGANVYKNTVATMESTFASRTSLSYIAEKVRQNDHAGAVQLGEIAGVPALVIAQEEAPGVYTYIYLYEGHLTELLAGENTPLQPDLGQAITPLAALEMTEDGGLLSITATEAQGTTHNICLYLHT